MEIGSIFTTMLITDYLKLDNNALSEFCKQAAVDAQKNGPYPVNQSRFLDLSNTILQPLLDEIYVRINWAYRTAGFKKNKRLKILRAWANVNNTYAIDLPHAHPDGFFSGVYYVSGSGTDQNGTLNLMAPIAALQHCIPANLIEKNTIYNMWGWQITPETGKLVIFPSWIIHNVSRNELDVDRISIAFDAVLEDA